mmetsp:Transcript_31880/g.52582  ORF Transcript_31880/g.52582 Transcript_31880/m.52582 type:complete len:292 (-) Transcript_31880:177-1052(-)|eukprot:CAMPEP_0119016736 /NCGR_PEP_ID=MMETSP1176-20130426/14277_1 /TAXON_ID=265551 /ORGANISM="Synedropsis recta cf, Strain CCMP1620" /LENGTH=291 /DNA_ID=CAMNT_0006970259 /DNA_START=66 /DNA_END=941 /DNA_ORIENTATION=-
MPLAIDSPTMALNELSFGQTNQKKNAETPVFPEQQQLFSDKAVFPEQQQISSDKGRQAEPETDVADKENMHSQPPSSTCSVDAVLKKDSDTTEQSDDATLGETFTLSGEANGASAMGDSLFHLPSLAGLSLQESRDCSIIQEERDFSSPFEDRRDDFDDPRFLQTRVQYTQEYTSFVPETRDNAIMFLATSSDASWDGNVARETSLFDDDDDDDGDSIGSSCEGDDEYTDGEGDVHEEPAAIPSSVRPRRRRTHSKSSVDPSTSLHTVFLDWVDCLTGKHWAEIHDTEDGN